MAAINIPNAWDEEDWEKQADKPPLLLSRRPNPTAPPFNPPTAPRHLRPSAPEFESSHLPYTPSSGGVPKTLYKPELKILRRSSSETPGAQPPTPPTDDVAEKERREREHKERERRYKEARERIMGEPKDPDLKPKKTPTPKPPTPKPKRTSPNTTPPSRTPKSRPSPPRSPPRKQSPPRSSVTSLSLNGGDFTAAPTRHAPQRELDGKLLESQLLQAGQEAPLSAETDAAGLDWDSFSRDEGWSRSSYEYGGPMGYGNVPPRQQNPGIYGGAAAADFPTTTTSRYNVYTQGRTPYVEKAQKQPGGAQTGVVQAVRAPKGPDADGGRGFKGRGKVVGKMEGLRIGEEVGGL